MAENWKPNQNDIEHAVRVLRAYKESDGQIPQELYEATAELRGEVAVELAIFRIVDGEINILLTKRLPEDEIWPGEPYHLPGTTKRGKENREEALARLVEGEVKGNHLSQIHKAGEIDIPTARAATETALIYWTRGMGEPKVGEYFPIHRLPENIIDHHKKLIEIALSAFIGD